MKWLDDFMEPEDLLFVDRSENIAERKMWCQVLGLAVHDARGGAHETVEGRARKSLRVISARAWLSYDEVEPGSFRWVVGVLGLRKGVTAIRKSCGL